MSEAKTKTEHDAHLARYGTEPDWHTKPPHEVRSIHDALAAAAHLKSELPLIVQVHARDWDKVILADEVNRLIAYIARDRAKRGR